MSGDDKHCQKLLKVARCPNRNCDNGTIIIYNQGEAEQEQCQWCDARARYISAPSAIAAIPPADPDADRFRFLIADPETGRHLLSLLQQKKGNEDSLRRMIDRIKASKAGVTADGSTERQP